MKKFLTLFILATFAITGCSSEKSQQVSDKAEQQAEDAAQTVETKTEEVKEEAKKSADEAAQVDVVDTLIKTGKHSTLLAAIEASGLTETLKNGGPYTIFAPTDDAFKKVDPQALSNLLLPENKDELSKILTLHVVNGKLAVAELKTEDLVTLNGESVPVVVSETETVTYGPANVTAIDEVATNGVVHEIDAVVMPSSN